MRFPDGTEVSRTSVWCDVPYPDDDVRPNLGLEEVPSDAMADVIDVDFTRARRSEPPRLLVPESVSVENEEEGGDPDERSDLHE